MNATIRTLACIALSISWPCYADPAVDLVRVLKAEHKLQLIAEGNVINEFSIALGGNPRGHKQEEGDQKTPEGAYILDYKKADSSFYRAIHISYPSDTDRINAKKRGANPGGQIMIHGQRNRFGWLSLITQRFDWTDGCVALSNADMDTVWQKVTTGTPIELLP